MVVKIEIRIGLKSGLELGKGRIHCVYGSPHKEAGSTKVERRKLCGCLRAETEEIKCMKASSSSSSSRI